VEAYLKNNTNMIVEINFAKKVDNRLYEFKRLEEAALNLKRIRTK